MAWSRLERRWLLAIMAAAVAVRVLGLGESLWYDEAVSAKQAGLAFGDMLAATARDNYPPLHNLVLFPLVHLFGASELALRLPSVVFGILGVWATWRLARDLLSARAALLATALVALSPLHVYYAHEGRMYALFAWTAVVSVHALVRWLRQPTRGRAVAYVAATTLLLYAHVYAGFIVLAQNAFVAWLWWRARRAGRTASSAQVGSPSARPAPPLRRWLVLQLAAAALFAPWAVVLCERIAAVEGDFWIPRLDLGELALTALRYWSLAAPLAAVAIVVALWPRRARAEVDAAEADADAPLLLALWLGVTLVASIALSLVSQPIFLSRYTIAASVAAYLLVALGVARAVRAPRAFAAVALALVLLQLRGVVADLVTPQRADWRGLAADMLRRAGPDERVIVWQPFEIDSLQHYAPGLAVAPVPMGREVFGAAGQAAVADAVAGARAVWLVWSNRKLPQGEAFLEGELRLLGRPDLDLDYFKLHARRFILYRAPPG
ncbi:MAG: glycosyltransferase family 39 protein [Myxococcota bacterium]